MPTYDHACADCGGFETLRPIARRDEPAPCPRCGCASPRVVAAAPRLAALDDATRRAMGRNELARHEPRSATGDVRLRHPSGCGCCRSGTRSSGAAGGGLRASPGRRPWMISH